MKKTYTQIRDAFWEGHEAAQAGLTAPEAWVKSQAREAAQSHLTPVVPIGRAEEPRRGGHWTPATGRRCVCTQ